MYNANLLDYSKILIHNLKLINQSYIYWFYIIITYKHNTISLILLINVNYSVKNNHNILVACS